MEESGLGFPGQPALPCEQPSQVIDLADFSHQERLFLLQIEQVIEEFDNLHVQTEIPMSQLSGVLLELDLKGIIQQN